MKLAKTNNEEIMSLMNILNEIQSFNGELRTYNFEDIELEEEYSPILHKIKKETDTIEEFMEGVFMHLSNIHHSRILWNCDVLIENCADPDLSYLDFKPDIKKGLELLETSEASS